MRMVVDGELVFMRDFLSSDKFGDVMFAHLIPEA